MKLPTKCILDKYDTYRKILKFSIKNDDDPQYKDFSLIDSYIMILIEIEKNLDGIFEEKVRIRHSTNYEEPLKESKFESLLYSIIGISGYFIIPKLLEGDLFGDEIFDPGTRYDWDRSDYMDVIFVQYSSSRFTKLRKSFRP